MQTFANLLLIGFFIYQSIVLIAITFKPFLILSFLPVARYQERKFLQLSNEKMLLCDEKGNKFCNFDPF